MGRVRSPQRTATGLAADPALTSSFVARDDGLPTGAFGQTFNRLFSTSNVNPLVSGQLYLNKIRLPAGVTVTNINMASGTTASSGCTHCWFSLWSAAFAKLGVTADDTAAVPWAANTIKTLALAVPVVTPSYADYYLGIVVVGTVPTVRGAGNIKEIANLPPITGTGADTGLVAPGTAPATATPVAANGGILCWGYVT